MAAARATKHGAVPVIRYRFGTKTRATWPSTRRRGTPPDAPRRLRVAVTGNIGSGKSTVARCFEAWGADRIDADAVTRQLQEPGQPVFDAIVRRFGNRILQSDGTLDRRALRDVVLADPDARADLNAIVHPAVYAALDAAIAKRQTPDDGREAFGVERPTSGSPPIVVEIPLLFETGTAGRFDRVVLVQAPRALILERLVTGRGLDSVTAARFLDAQAEASKVRQLSDFVIENDGSVDELEAKAYAVWRKLPRPA
ncbi:MAG TPA: dephospho-CoA kinase [Gemmatimonadales bacterium]|nr:dephospho-CoA kinase [Gemmatimonadales bacterium]